MATKEARTPSCAQTAQNEKISGLLERTAAALKKLTENVGTQANQNKSNNEATTKVLGKINTFLKATVSVVQTLKNTMSGQVIASGSSGSAGTSGSIHIMAAPAGQSISVPKI